jgi:hypothetical protein
VSYLNTPIVNYLLKDYLTIQPALGKFSNCKIERIGAQEILATEISFEPNSFMTTISIPEPDWAVNTGHM